jgi:predicted HNH restriction endonuclease
MERHNGRLPCEVCGFEFLKNYGPVGAGFAEAHHKTSLAESPAAGRITSLDDLAVACSNCHRMLDRSPEYPSIESLRNHIRRARKKAQQDAPADVLVAASRWQGRG